MLTIELDKLKQSKALEFNDIDDFNTHEGKEWLIGFVNVNEHIYVLDAELQCEVIEIEKDIFSPRVKLQITVAPMKHCIQEKLKKFL